MATQENHGSLRGRMSVHRSAQAGYLLLLCFVVAVAMQPAPAQTFSVIHNFVGGLDGSEPTSGLTMDHAGNLYGTTFEGDAGTGTLYRLSHHSGGWLLSPLFYFNVPSNGVIPYDPPVIGPSGVLYATTGYGGTGPCFSYGNTGCGTVFTLQPQPTPPPTPVTPWIQTVLYRFSGGADGSNPYGGALMFDRSGNMYGTTYNGGTGNCSGGCGVVFKLTPSAGGWTESIIYDFTNGSDGAHPWAGLIPDAAGNLYGTAAYGGDFGSGTVYELTPSGSGYTLRTLYSFHGQTDGANPYAGLIFDAQGNLYGATANYGPGSGGTVFELTPSGGNWIFNILYSFSGPSGGFFPGPIEKLTFDSQGNLYGTTHLDGAFNFGAVFKLTHGNNGWSYTSLHDFTAGVDGGEPRSSIVFDANGNMYGTAAEGGTGNRDQCVGSCGVVFQITP